MAVRVDSGRRPASGLQRAASIAIVALLGTGCIGYSTRHPIQWDSSTQISASESSQVAVRSVQSRVYDTSDETQVLRAVLAALQDLGFQIELLDETLGVVSAKQYLPAVVSQSRRRQDYLRYDEESLVVFQRAWRSWGPFWKRSDLVRLTVTVRPRNESQLIVRASAQHFVRPIEEAEPYQSFYRVLDKALFISRLESETDESG